MSISKRLRPSNPPPAMPRHCASPPEAEISEPPSTYECKRLPLPPRAKTVADDSGELASRRVESALRELGSSTLDIAVDDNIDALNQAYAEAPFADPRKPTFLGQWKRSIPDVHDDFARDDLDEPHLKRKHAILHSHPEIASLYGVEHSTKYLMFALIATQLLMAYYVGRHTESLWFLLLSSYFVSGSITAIFGVFIHEAAHNLMHPVPFVNRLLALAANMPIVFPIAASFRRYHLEHHVFQGVLGRDADLPMPFEWTFIRGNAALKFVWVALFPIFYTMRGAAMLKTPQKWEIINALWTLLVCDSVYMYMFGARGMVYLALGLLLGYGLHPFAAHFIQEHFTFVPGQETFSYYGPLNVPMLNIGYHNEHHDFIRISWRKLPRVRAIAPEFYNTITYHTSWVGCIWDFITRSDIGPQSRVSREFSHHVEGRAMLRNKKNVEPSDTPTTAPLKVELPSKKHD